MVETMDFVFRSHRRSVLARWIPSVGLSVESGTTYCKAPEVSQMSALGQEVGGRLTSEVRAICFS